jgi:hypothetical protein
MTDVTTKIELVTEAIETLTLAQVHLCSPSLSDHDRMRQAKNLADARACLADALRILLQPTLRVVTNSAPPAPPENVPYGGEGISGMGL